MYERFTDRARQVMQYANQEAQRFNHEYIGTEHILLGLAKEGTGVAARVLKDFGLDLLKLRGEVEKLVQADAERGGTGKLPQTPFAKKVVEYAIEESRNLNHSYVGTEHLLLGLLRQENGVAIQVLKNLGLTPDAVRNVLLTMLEEKEQSRVDTLVSVPRSSPAMTAVDVIHDRNRPAGFLLVPSPETLDALERLRVFSQRETMAETLAALIQAFFWLDPLFTGLAMEVRELAKLPEPETKQQGDVPYEQRPM